MYETEALDLWDYTSEGIQIDLNPEHWERGSLNLTRKDLLEMLEVCNEET